VRLVHILGADLNVFDFDYDLTWAAFFLSADGKVYGRYGGRDARSAEDRISLAGLHYAMQAALAAHAANASARPTRQLPPRRVEDYPAAKRLFGNQCIHCHQVHELIRQSQNAAGTWRREDLWIYPLPDNVGLVLEVDRGNHVRAVPAHSPADQAGVRPGDVLVTLNHLPVASFADAQYALHRAPAKGPIPLAWKRGNQTLTGQLVVAQGWRKTNLTWRPSLLDLLPSLPLYGDDLGPAEKKALGLSPKSLAFRQDKTVHRDARAAGVQGGDIIVGLDNQPLEMTMPEFLGHVRRNYLVGDRVTLHVIRDGKRLDLTMTLR
jgi:serine protease Do